MADFFWSIQRQTIKIHWQNNGKTTIFLIPNNSNTIYFNDIFTNFDSIIFLKPIKFVGYEKTFPKSLIIVEFSGEKRSSNLNIEQIDVLGKKCAKLYYK